jgi:hypothetical protein
MPDLRVAIRRQVDARTMRAAPDAEETAKANVDIVKKQLNASSAR